MTLLSPDIDGQILSALKMIFTYELQEVLLSQESPYTLKTLKQADLQDDPTLTAPYLVFRDDLEKGVEPIKSGEQERMYGGTEIGGPVRNLHYFNCKFGTPLATTREQARKDISTLESHIEDTLKKYYDLSGVLAPGLCMSTDQTRRIENANHLLIDLMTKRIYGGEQTFYGEGRIYWHYPVARYRSERVYISA